jgi:tetratricopeptide (TPR) repeat protein
MNRTAILVLLLSCAGAAAPAGASEQSQALAARGLIELDAGHTQQALELFDQAVAADPTDANVLYQRGATRAKLGNYPGAIDDLRAALALRPEFPQADLELGIALTQNGQNKEAVPLLQRAQYTPALDAQASFFLGLAQLRLDRPGDARQNFERARLRDPSLELAVQYYEGVIDYRQHEYGTAAAHFSAVQRANPDSAMAHEATQFLVLMQRAQRAAYSAFGTVALEYDSNVTLGPNSTTTIPNSITGQGDGRVVLDAGGTYVPWSYGPVSLALSYEFFQSLQFRLTDFDLQDHRPSLQLMFDFDRVFVGLLARYDYYLLSTDSFLQETTAFPWVSLREDSIGRTEVYARLQWRHYYAKNSFAQLDGFYNFAGVRQIVDLGGPNRQLWFGYQLGFTDPDELGSEVYQYGSNQVEVALRWPLLYSIVGETGYRYEHQDYAAASGTVDPMPGRRHDNDHRIVVSFERPLSEIWDHLFVNASWFGTFNNSNKPIFEYQRQIGSIAAEVRF